MKELADLFVLLLDKERPKFFDDGLAKELQSLVAFSLVEEVEEQLPKLCDIVTHKIANRRQNLLAPQYAMRACQHQKTNLGALLICDMTWQVESMCEE